MNQADRVCTALPFPFNWYISRLSRVFVLWRPYLVTLALNNSAIAFQLQTLNQA